MRASVFIATVLLLLVVCAAPASADTTSWVEMAKLVYRRKGTKAPATTAKPTVAVTSTTAAPLLPPPVKATPAATPEVELVVTGTTTVPVFALRAVAAKQF
jgi:hypothetical protein